VAQPELLVEDVVEITVQVQGKMRARVAVPQDADAEQALALALADPAVQRHVEGRPVSPIYVPGRLVNLRFTV
jgi:leucyl-tRNA synthetase